MNSGSTKLAKPEDIQEPDWLLNMNWEKYEQLAAIGYSPEKLAMYFRIVKIEFMYWFMIPDGNLDYHYKRGMLVQQAKEGLAMINDADGNVTQAQRLDKLRDTIHFQKTRDEILYGGL
ncbi:MAG TPA: hypothetical protein VIK29_07655 [Paludibacter sp.]